MSFFEGLPLAGKHSVLEKMRCCVLKAEREYVAEFAQRLRSRAHPDWIWSDEEPSDKKGWWVFWAMGVDANPKLRFKVCVPRRTCRISLIYRDSHGGAFSGYSSFSPLVTLKEAEAILARSKKEFFESE